MKKGIALMLICCVLTALLAACSDSKNYNNANNPNSVENVLNNGGKAPSTAPVAVDSTQETVAHPPTPGVDVDLTQFSSKMVYLEVQNMFRRPDAYQGKIIKMEGEMSITEYQGKTYYACLVRDATACCANGIEFLWKGEHTAADYPAQGTPITVVGNFGTYTEDNQMYIQLTDATLEF